MIIQKKSIRNYTIKDTFIMNLTTFLFINNLYERKTYMHRTYKEALKHYENNMIDKSRITDVRKDFGYSDTIKHLFTCFKEKVEDGWSFDGEYHNFWELVYVTKGSIFISVDGKTQKLEKDEVIFFAPMVFHQMWCENCDSAKFMVISFGGNNELLTPLVENPIHLDLEKKEEISQLYNCISETFDVNLGVHIKPESKRNTIAERICFNKIEHFLLSLLNDKIIDEQKHMSIGNANYKLIIDTMNENINKNLTIEDLAKLCNLSVSNLKKTFKKYGNEGVMKYFNRMKINRAIRFLRSGTSSASIAQEMGFSSQNYFSVVFKRETGMLPSEFKRNKL